MLRARFDFLTVSEGKDEVSFPADWKEALKARFLPEKLKKRFPVRMKTVRLVAKAIVPDDFPKNLGPVITVYTRDEV